MTTLIRDDGASDADRWTDRPGGTDGDEAAAVQLLLAVRATPPPGAEALARMQVRLMTAAAAPYAPAGNRWRMIAVAASVTILLAGGAVAKIGMVPQRWPARVSLLMQEIASIVTRKARRPEPRVAMETHVALAPATNPGVETVALPDEPPRVFRPLLPRANRERARLQTEAAIAGAPAADPEIAAESGLLGAAIRALRAGKDAASALQLLDQYQERFAHGTLAAEAGLTRLETLRALNRSAEALALLDNAALVEVPRARELRVLRGELRAEGKRYREAMSDFEAALALSGAGADDLRERALYGRALCRSRTGDNAGAREDFQRYLRIFAGSPRAAAVQQALERNSEARR